MRRTAARGGRPDAGLGRPQVQDLSQQMLDESWQHNCIIRPDSLQLSATITFIPFFLCLNSDDDISLFVPCFDIPVSLGNLFQWIAPIDDRFNRSGLNKLFEGKQIICRIACCPRDYSLDASLRSPSPSNPA